LYHLTREEVQFKVIFVIPKSRDLDAANLGILDSGSRDYNLQK